MIHKFQQEDMFIVLDVNSGAIHIIDELIYNILDYYPKNSKEYTLLEIKKIFASEYNDDDILDAIDEIDELIEQEQLFCTDKYIFDTTWQKNKPVIKAMCLHVAHDCNIRCAYCFASQGDFEGDRSLMPLEVGKNALEFLCTHSGNRKNLEVDFFGGEPLMNFDVVKELVNFGRKLEKKYNKNFRFTITTNGVLLSKDTIEFIDKEMNNVVLSMDGRPSVNDRMRYTISGGGTYDIILPKFQEMAKKRENRSYYVRGTFTRYNTDFASDVIHMADQGFDQISVEPVVAKPEHDYALRNEDLPQIFEQYDKLARDMAERRKNGKDFNFFHFMVDLSQGPCIAKRLSGCGAGSEYIAVTPQGDIYPCHQFVGDERFKMGSVLSGEIDNKMNAEFKNAHVYNKEDCKTCWAKFYCSGGCHANAFNFNDDINKPYALGCEMEKKRLECAIYLKGKQMLETQV